MNNEIILQDADKHFDFINKKEMNQVEYLDNLHDAYTTDNFDKVINIIQEMKRIAFKDGYLHGAKHMYDEINGTERKGYIEKKDGISYWGGEDYVKYTVKKSV